MNAKRIPARERWSHMPSVPVRLAILAACALAVTAPAQAQKQPPGATGPSGGSQFGNQNPDQSKKSPYSAVDPTATTPAPATPAPGTSQQSGTKRRNTVVVDRGKKSADSADTSAGATTTVTPPATPAAPVTPVATTPTPTTGSGTKKRTKHRSSKRSSRSSAGTRGVARVVTPVAAVPAATKPAAQHKSGHRSDKKDSATPRNSVVTRTVHDIVKVIPAPLKAVIAGLAALALAALAGWIAVTLRARHLKRQRRELLAEVGLLQAALLPEVPERLGPLAASAAYRPADGPAAGGDFYDVFEMEDGRIGVVLGDVAGHGRDALARTAMLRYTLRAYLETGLEPRTTLRLGGETLDHNLASFATAVVAIYDPAAGTLTYSCAGHPPPILLGPAGHDPITVCSAPPIGVGERTGDRQTTVVLPAGSVACFFTDGLAEARTSGNLLGRGRLVEMLADLGDEPTATELLERVRRDVTHTPDDMAACILRPVITLADARPIRIEELELREDGETDLRRFLAACAVPPAEVDALVRESDARAEDYGGAIVRVTLGDSYPQVSIVLPMIELLAAARR
jgi:Stage II sporulation protein E (SpoIIE)